MSERIAVKTAEADKADEIDLGRLLGTVLDHRWLIISITTIFTMLGILYALLATPVYQADAMVQVEQNVSDSLMSDISKVLPDTKPQSAPEVELLRSRMVVGKTVQDLGLDTDVEQQYFPLFGKGLARLKDEEPARVVVSRLSVPDSWLDEKMTLAIGENGTYRFSAGKDADFTGHIGQVASQHGFSLLVSSTDAAPGTVFTVRKKNTLTAINDILAELSVADKGKDTGVLQLTLEGSDPALVKKTLTSISDNYLQQNVDRKSEEAARSLAFLKEQLPLVRASLETAEDKLNKYRQQKDSVDLSLEAKSVLDTIVDVESQLNQLTFREAEISKLYTREHPAYRALLEKRVTLEKERDSLNRRVSSMPKTQQEIVRLTRDVNVGQEVYVQLMNKQQELSINKASTVGNVRIIDPAVVQLKPVKPKKTLVIVLAAMLGGVAAIGFVLLKTLLHRGIESPEQLEELGINVYASVPLSEWQQKKDREFAGKNRKRNARSDSLLAVGNPADLAIEAIRSLRTSLHFAMMEAKNNVLMISGASPGIGKSFISANLGAVIAQAGQRVLIVDCDMRKGYAHHLLGATPERGLSDILSGQIEAQQALRTTVVENLFFIPRGQIPPNPSELLMHSHFTDFINWATGQFDIVLLDTPPILAVTDAAIISRQAGTSLLVARFETNTPKEVEISIRRFEQNGAPIKGVILNAVIRRALSYYSYGYDSYQYSYGSDKK
ncbi:tyrosine-protein kinase Wzc [Dickeya parazeae]|uniref:Capsular exopolysaccharide family n=1 Tax=Dickeya zeae (strain Ech586) TaxID=590409 RepID=D2BVG7_DICZ5|nr:tyrosine-protein kinase Wzc [Dickeya parazeae]ACZ76121.1 capsular exopolysaccharide family [Dickeya parazeae Ech586]MBP2835113.1 tyrosine-protein kinase Wzc [Dickeya parazeae]